MIPTDVRECPVMMPVRKSAFADERGETGEKQEYYGTFHDKASSPYTRKTRSSAKREPIRFDYPLFASRASDLKDFVTK